MCGRVFRMLATHIWRTHEVWADEYRAYFGLSNYWRDPELFGMPGSHGCVSMLDEQALLLWQFAEIGTPLRIRRA
jgi:hypothetical protein